MEALGEDYFVAIKIIMNKNKSIKEHFSYAKEFLKVFPLYRTDFYKPAACAFF